MALEKVITYDYEIRTDFKHIQEREGNTLSWRAARAMANAEIADCYKDLVLEEEESNLKDETIEGRSKE